EGDLLRLTAVLTGVVLELAQVDGLVLLPGVELVRAGRDRLLAEGLRVLEERVRLRRKGRVAQTHRQVRDLLGGLDGEGVVVDDLQAGHLLSGGLAVAGAGVITVTGALDIVEALDRR